MWLNRENQLFSSVLEDSVSNRQVCLMAHASLAFSALVCAGFVSAVPALLCLAWFVVSLHLCKKVHIPEHTRSLSGSLLGYKTIP